MKDDQIIEQAWKEVNDDWNMDEWLTTFKREAFELVIKKKVEDIITYAKKYSGMIETIEDLFEHMDRLQKCSRCRKDFYDKVCPECSYKTSKEDKE